MIEWREIQSRQPVNGDHPPMELSRTNDKWRRWGKVEGGKVFLGREYA